MLVTVNVGLEEKSNRYRCGRKTRILDGRCGNCSAEEVVITAASTLWALLLLLLGLRGVSVLLVEDVSIADVTATTLVFSEDLASGGR